MDISAIHSIGTGGFASAFWSAAFTSDLGTAIFNSPSGKYFKHLSLGQPVIVNKVPGLAKEIEKYKVGVVIDSLSELNDAVQRIKTDYDTYVQNIKRIYAKRYDYQKVSQHFFDFVICHARIKKEEQKVC